MKYYKKNYPEPNEQDVMCVYCYNEETKKTVSVYDDCVVTHVLSDNYHTEQNDFIESTKDEFEEAFNKTIIYLKSQL